MVEFALILTPLLLVLLGIMQMGLVLNAYVTITNAAREGGRSATVYLYDRTKTKAQNDTARAEAARASLTSAMGMLATSAPQFANSATWTASGSTFTTGDLVVSYELPGGATETDTRTGQNVRIQMTYHLDLIIPFIGAILPHDANGRLPMTADVTMVVN
jgi:Flp pilus assembly protein TadG